MRVEPYAVGSFVHIYNQGNRKQPIVLDEKDKWRFLLMLRYFNDEYSPHDFSRELKDLRQMKQKGRIEEDQGKVDFLNHYSDANFRELIDWPKNWPDHDPLVNIVCFVLMENHYHLILEEIKEGGITCFMQKLGTGMTMYFNTKYKESGRLFKGSFKSKTIDNNEYLSYLSVYIQVKNIFERYPGGLKKAISELDKALGWAVKDPYGSLADYADERNSPIIEKSVLGKMFSSSREYKDFARECILGMNFEQKIKNLILD